MLKNSLAIIVIANLVAGSSFANPLHVKKMFMKDQMMKSSLATKSHTQHSPSKFTGTWTGICTHDGENEVTKVRIEEDGIELTMTDLINEGGNDTASFNVLESKTRTDKDFYESFTSRLTRINENTIQLEGSEVIASTTNKEKGLVSGVFSSILTINNNQLTIDTRAKRTDENAKESVDICLLKRIG